MTIHDRYRAVRLLRSVHQFSLSQIFQVQDLEAHGHDRKILRVVYSTRPSQVEILELMARALNRFHSPYPVAGAPQVEGAMFQWQPHPRAAMLSGLVLTYIEGTPLDQWIQQQGKISQLQAIAWLKQLVQIVGRLHQVGFLHRDIKPENLIVQPDNQIALIDFNSVCEMDFAYLTLLSTNDPHIIAPRFSRSTAVSSGYSPWEQTEGKAIASSDYFAIGRTLCHLLTGQHPNELPNDVNTNRLRWHSRASHIDPVLLTFIDQLMSHNPFARPQNPDQIVQLLDQLPDLIRWRQIWRSRSGRLILAVGAGIVLTSLLQVTRMSIARYLLSEGNRLQLLSQTDQAQEYLQRALRFQFNNPAIHTALGQSYAESGELEAAIAAFRQAIQLNPDYGPAYLNLGTMYERIGDPNTAEEFYRSATQFLEAPARYSAINNLARLMIIQGNPQAAIELINQHLNQVDDLKILASFKKNLGWAYYQQREWEQAYTWLSQALDDDPTRPDSYCLLAKTLEKLNKPDLAFDEWQTCLYLPTPAYQPELQQWKQEFLSRVNYAQTIRTTL